MITKYLITLKSPEYKENLPKINEINRRNIIFVSSIAIVAIGFLLLILPLVKALPFAYPIYVGFEIVTILILLEAIFIKPKSSPLLIPLTIALVLDLLTFGIFLSFVDTKNGIGTVFYVLLFSIPLVFTLHPAYMVSITIVASSIFIYLQHATKPEEMFTLSLIFVCCYSLLSIIIGTYMFYVKIKNSTLEKEHEAFTKLKLQESEIAMNKQMEIMHSLSGIYNSIHLIDLEENTVVEYVSNENIRKYVYASEDAVTQMHNSMDSLMTNEYKQIAFEFTDLTTLKHRMEGKKVITIDMVGIFTDWLRASFITNTTNSLDQPTQVLFTTQIIDEEKRREEALFKQSNTDSLTGLFNRHAFEEDINQYAESVLPDNFAILVFDINGLKKVNDTLGHSAGDELITGAVSCIKACFGRYGKLYRTGGDEFVAMFSAHKTEIKELLADFERTTKKWVGYEVQSLSVSVGYAAHKDYKSESIIDLEKIADKKMYEEKAKYYSSENTDRRNR